MGVTVCLNFFQPILNMRKSFPPGYIVHQQCPDSTPVVRSSDWSKVFLSGCIPNLEFDIFVFDGDSFGTELNTDGDVVGGAGFVFDEL